MARKLYIALRRVSVSFAFELFAVEINEIDILEII
jgi:hypothetical protein